MVEMMFSPVRLETSSEMADWPLIRAKPSGSLKVRLSTPMSRKRTTASRLTLTGMSRMSSAVSNRPGTLTAKRPWPVSNEPAATSRLERPTASMMSRAFRL